MACLLLSFGFHPNNLSLVMSSSMFFTSPIQPLPPSARPMNLNSTPFSLISSTTILAMVLTLVWSSELML